MSLDTLMSKLVLSAAALLLGACALGGNRAVAPLVFDLGPVLPVAQTQFAPAEPQLAELPMPELQLTEISAPPWLATPGIAYRLGYLNEFQTYYYRDSRWLAPPAVLLSERLRQKLALVKHSSNAGKPIALRLELHEFEQRFSSSTQSAVRVGLRARLGEGTAASLQSFEVVLPSDSADASGAVRAFSAAGDQILTQVLAWAALKSRP